MALGTLFVKDRETATPPQNSPPDEQSPVSHDGNLRNRLLHLIEMLERLPAAADAGGNGAGAAMMHLGRISDDRLRTLTAMLRERISDIDVDVEDALLARLLLDHYTNAIGHLRALSKETDDRLTGVQNTIRDGRRAIELERRRAESRQHPKED
jgi:hypothetical protein